MKVLGLIGGHQRHSQRDQVSSTQKDSPIFNLTKGTIQKQDSDSRGIPSSKGTRGNLIKSRQKIIEQSFDTLAGMTHGDTPQRKSFKNKSGTILPLLHEKKLQINKISIKAKDTRLQSISSSRQKTPDDSLKSSHEVSHTILRSTLHKRGKTEHRPQRSAFQNGEVSSSRLNLDIMQIFEPKKQVAKKESSGEVKILVVTGMQKQVSQNQQVYNISELLQDHVVSREGIIRRNSNSPLASQEQSITQSYLTTGRATETAVGKNVDEYRNLNKKYNKVEMLQLEQNLRKSLLVKRLEDPLHHLKIQTKMSGGESTDEDKKISTIGEISKEHTFGLFSNRTQHLNQDSQDRIQESQAFVVKETCFQKNSAGSVSFAQTNRQKRSSAAVSQSDLCGDSSISFVIQGPQYNQDQLRNTTGSSMLKHLLNIQHLTDIIQGQQFKNIQVKNSEFDTSPRMTPNKSSHKKNRRFFAKETSLPKYRRSIGGLIKGVKTREENNKKPIKIDDCISYRKLSSLERSQIRNLQEKDSNQKQQDNDYALGMNPTLMITSKSNNTKIYYGSQKLNEKMSRQSTELNFNKNSQLGSSKYINGQSPRTALRKQNNSSTFQEIPSPLKNLDLTKIQTVDLNDQTPQFHELTPAQIITTEETSPIVNYQTQGFPNSAYISHSDFLGSSKRPSNRDYRSSRGTLVASKNRQVEDSSSFKDTNRYSLGKVIAPKFSGIIGIKNEIEIMDQQQQYEQYEQQQDMELMQSMLQEAQNQNQQILDMKEGGLNPSLTISKAIMKQREKPISRNVSPDKGNEILNSTPGESEVNSLERDSLFEENVDLAQIIAKNVLQFQNLSKELKHQLLMKQQSMLNQIIEIQQQIKQPRKISPHQKLLEIKGKPVDVIKKVQFADTVIQRLDNQKKVLVDMPNQHSLTFDYIDNQTKIQEHINSIQNYLSKGNPVYSSEKLFQQVIEETEKLEVEEVHHNISSFQTPNMEKSFEKQNQSFFTLYQNSTPYADQSQSFNIRNLDEIGKTQSSKTEKRQMITKRQSQNKDYQIKQQLQQNSDIIPNGDLTQFDELGVVQNGRDCLSVTKKDYLSESQTNTARSSVEEMQKKEILFPIDKLIESNQYCLPAVPQNSQYSPATLSTTSPLFHQQHNMSLATFENKPTDQKIYEETSVPKLSQDSVEKANKYFEIKNEESMTINIINNNIGKISQNSIYQQSNQVSNYAPNESYMEKKQKISNSNAKYFRKFTQDKSDLSFASEIGITAPKYYLNKNQQDMELRSFIQRQSFDNQIKAGFKLPQTIAPRYQSSAIQKRKNGLLSKISNQLKDALGEAKNTNLHNSLITFKSRAIQRRSLVATDNKRSTLLLKFDDYKPSQMNSKDTFLLPATPMKEVELQQIHLDLQRARNVKSQDRNRTNYVILKKAVSSKKKSEVMKKRSQMFNSTFN